MNKTSGLWYNFFDLPAVYNFVRAILLFGKEKMYKELKNAIAITTGETILDVGSGPGELSQLFSEEYTGVDYSQNYVQYAQKKYPNKKFFQGNVLDLNIPEKSYDIVLLASFIHHFSDEEVRNILNNLRKVTRKRIILLEPCPWKENPLAAVFLKLDRGAHIRSLKEQKKILEEYFLIKNVHTFHSGFYKLSILIAQPKES